MGKPTGFLEYERKNGAVAAPSERTKNFREFHGMLDREQQRLQGARCMDCGVPFCQAGMMIAGMASGCPLHNLVPEINDLVYHGNWEQAYVRLSKTHSFPEFTSRVCPALCEAACTCGLHAAPVSTKENERQVIEYAYEHGLVKADPPAVRTGKRVAVVGSGPAGLAAAQQLNTRGHSVTVYERSDRAGGLLRYGIPNMKLEKRIIDRRIKLMEAAGIQFVYNTDVGKDISGQQLLDQYDRVILAGGASNPRDIKVPGRDAEGIYFAVDFLKQVTKALLDDGADQAADCGLTGGENPGDGQKSPAVASEQAQLFDNLRAAAAMAQGKHVLVIGGGDTGNDCVGTAIRLGAKSVTQLEMMPRSPESRLESNPWPEWPKVLKTDYGQEEAIDRFGQDPRIYQTTVKEFLKDEQGHVQAAVIVSLRPVKDEKTGRMNMVPVEGSEQKLPADLVLIAAGFLGSEAYVADTFGVKLNARTNVETKTNVDTGAEGYQTCVEKVFAAGDMRRGQSLVVWAIAEGRNAAKAVDESLMGYSGL